MNIKTYKMEKNIITGRITVKGYREILWFSIGFKLKENGEVKTFGSLEETREFITKYHKANCENAAYITRAPRN